MPKSVASEKKCQRCLVGHALVHLAKPASTTGMQGETRGPSADVNREGERGKDSRFWEATTGREKRTELGKGGLSSRGLLSEPTEVDKAKGAS